MADDLDSDASATNLIDCWQVTQVIMQFLENSTLCMCVVHVKATTQHLAKGESAPTHFFSCLHLCLRGPHCVPLCRGEGGGGRESEISENFKEPGWTPDTVMPQNKAVVMTFTREEMTLTADSLAVLMVCILPSLTTA